MNQQAIILSTVTASTAIHGGRLWLEIATALSKSGCLGLGSSQGSWTRYSVEWDGIIAAWCDGKWRVLCPT